MARLFLRQLDREGSMGFALRGEHGGGGRDEAAAVAV